MGRIPLFGGAAHDAQVEGRGGERAGVVGARRGEPIILKVAAEKLAATGHRFYLSSNGAWLTDHVPASFLREI